MDSQRSWLRKNVHKLLPVKYLPDIIPISSNKCEGRFLQLNLIVNTNMTSFVDKHNMSNLACSMGDIPEQIWRAYNITKAGHHYKHKSGTS
jgi:hypothetical protein